MLYRGRACGGVICIVSICVFAWHKTYIVELIGRSISLDTGMEAQSLTSTLTLEMATQSEKESNDEVLGFASTLTSGKSTPIEKQTFRKAVGFEPNVFMPGHAIAASVAKELRVFVYELSDSIMRRATLHGVRDNVIAHGRFEFVFIDLLKNSSHRVSDPRTADFFFVPAPLGLIMTRMRTRMKLKKGDSCQKCLDFESNLIAELRQVGPYWDRNQSRHIVLSYRCPHASDSNPPNNEKVDEFLSVPRLNYGKALVLCLMGYDDAPNKIDMKRSLHTGYYVAPKLYGNLLGQDPQSRNIFAMYAGANPVGMTFRGSAARRYVWQGLKNCSSCATLQAGSKHRRPQPDDNFFNRLQDLLYHARFQIVPPGDGGNFGRPSRDQSITMGVVPVLWGYANGGNKGGSWMHFPWSDLLNWSAFSVNFTYTRPPDENMWPRLEHMLRELERSGEAARLSAGVAAVQDRLFWNETGIVRLLMESLAIRM